MDTVTPAWVGSVFLFIHSDETDLSAMYQEPQLRLKIYKALKLTLADAAGSSAGFEILKIYGSGFGLELKFTEEKKCRNFLHNYRNDKLQQALAYHFGNQCIPSITCRTVLKAGTVTLDDILDNPEGCLRHIKENEPNHLRDDEVSRLEEDIRRMVLEYSSNCQSTETQCSVNSKTPTVVSTLSPISPLLSSPSSIEANGSLLCSTDRFEFQGVLFGEC
ncbi:tumor necrosis factor receptor type 1-associated DEATH domain protein isoform X2 [Rhincodon typus]|nr:tumor necrosis factor receptor type 1-associated DEATH domain protein isoform X2 [Rhincodon typus]XP_048461736.1 tumor necrosis factor receptor type 1-associated DEATH domain protein isoform X2 [Rhincodon typus]